MSDKGHKTKEIQCQTQNLIYNTKPNVGYRTLCRMWELRFDFALKFQFLVNMIVFHNFEHPAQTS